MKINESEWNYHFGENHNGKPYYSDNKNQMYGRDTGHFGSGTYFSTYKLYPHERNGQSDIYKSEQENFDPHFIQIKDGIYRVDLDLYKNLYRVRSTRHGDVLYSMLKNVNAFYNKISSFGGFKQSEAIYDNALIYQKIQRNAKALNLKCPSYYDLTRMAQNHTGDQSFSTVFMEYNGYNGVNVSGIDFYDNTTHGSVIYDLSKIDTEMEQIEPNSLYTSERNPSHSSITVFNSDDDEMNAATGQYEILWVNKLNDMPLPKVMRILKNNIDNGNVLEAGYLNKLSSDVQSRYLRLLYKRYTSGYSDTWGLNAGYKIFYDYKNKSTYIDIIIKNNAFYWVNYTPKEYGKNDTGFTFIANHLFWDIPYDADEIQSKIKIIDKLKTYLTRELTDYEKHFIDEETTKTEFDEAKKTKKKRLEEKLSRTIDEIINEVEERRGNIGTYYHGGDISHDLWYNGVLWLTPEDYYAKEYAKIRKNPVIYEIKVNENKLFPGSIYEIFGDDGDPYEGPEKDEIPLLLDEGYNCYYMDYVDAEGLVLFNKDPIVSIRPLSSEEYEEVEEMEY